MTGISQASARAAAVEFVTDYAVSMDVKLQVYPARPRTLYPPTAFVDRIRETDTVLAGLTFQRTITVDVLIVHGLFDSNDAAIQKDAFVDGMYQWVIGREHTAGANSLIRIAGTEDLPDWVPEWIPPGEQRTYYATEITLEGFGTN